MKIDWGRVPEKTLVKFKYSDGSSAIEFFGMYNEEDNKIISYEFDDFSDSESIWECADNFSLVMPEDIEKYSIKEEPKYVCPVCGGEVEQQEDYRDVRQIFTLGKYDVKEKTYQFHICENPNCGVVIAGKNGHFGKKVE